MPRPIHIRSHPDERQLSVMSLSAAAESGAVARDLGYLPARQLTPPARRVHSPSSIFYVWPDSEPQQRRA